MNAVKTFSVEECREQVKRVLDFPAFKNSPTLTNFFKYVTSETIQDRAQHIKEYTIAISVLHRQADFNPHEDAIVRIHAGRLRRMLKEYYLLKGAHDPINIFIPKGCYIPQFLDAKGGKIDTDNALTHANDCISKVIAVFPFKIVSQCPKIKELALMLGEQLSAELSRFEEISVIGYYSMEVTAKINENILEAGKVIDADYIITGNIQSLDQTIRIRINLLIAKTGEVLFTKVFERNDLSSFTLHDEIISSVIDAVGAEGLIIHIIKGVEKADNNILRINQRSAQG